MYIPYCLNCDKDADYHIRVQQDTFEVRGKVCSCKEYIPYCLECGNELYIPDINDLNVDLHNRAYDISIMSIQELKDKAKKMGYNLIKEIENDC